MTLGRSVLGLIAALVLLAGLATSVSAEEETRFCVTVRSEGPIETDLLAAVAAGEASILIEGPEACVETGSTTGRDDAVARLESLRVAPERPTGYERGLFRHWVDADGDGCDTRREVLITEALTPVAVGPSCALTGGSWRSAYDGVETTAASAFDIDHVVPLAEAWRSGARDWGDRRRQRFANDLADERTLRAVTAASNRSKGDRDPADWLPPDEAFHCTYAEDWIAIKATWDLAVDVAERDALAEVLADC